MKKVNININGETYEIEQGKTILNAARENDIWIPTLCHEERLEPYGGCRMCLVEVEGARQPVVSCVTRAGEGMAVKTETENIQKIRRGVLDYILSDHPLDCMTCEATGCCELQDLAYKMEVYGLKYRNEDKRGGAIPDKNELIYRETSKCIRCGRCVRICGEVQQDRAIEFGGRGFQMWVATPFGESLLDGSCVLCGQCVSTCPTGALYEKRAMNKGRSFRINKVRSTCGFCSIGCQIDIHTNNKKITKITSEAGGVPNNGNLCMKGRFTFDFINHPDRLDTPLIRRNGNLEKAGWNEAYDVIAEKLKKIKSRHGSNSISFIGSGRCTNEDNYLLQKFARAVIGTNNIDQSETDCHAPTLDGLGSTLGFGAATNSIEEISRSDVIFVIGANVTEAHPIIGLEIKKAVRNGKTLILADTRKIWLSKIAGTYLAIQPGTDIHLINAMIGTIINEKRYDENFVNERTKGLEVLKSTAAKTDIKKAERLTGVPEKMIIEAARTYANAEKATILYGNGVTQHMSGTDNVKSIVNLALLTGNIGKEGTGVNPLPGQNNGQGAFFMGALPNLYTDFQPVSSNSIRKKFEDVYGVYLPKKSGLQLREMFNKAHEGKVRAMYIMGADVMMSGPDTIRLSETLKGLELLVVQDIFMSSTAQYADVVLPSACYAEKDGTFTNIERRVQRVRKTFSAPGDAKEDWEIISGLANHMGYVMDYDSPEAIWEEIRTLSPNFAGISYKRLESGGLQWPCPDVNHPGTKFLYEEGFANGKAKFTRAEGKPHLEKPDKNYPLTLSTGRTLFHFNSGTMTQRAKGSVQKQPYPFVEISQKDANAIKIKDGAMVKVATKRGMITLRSSITNRVMHGQIWIPFHFINAQANLLTKDPFSAPKARDNSSFMPTFKTCAARVEKA